VKFEIHVMATITLPMGVGIREPISDILNFSNLRDRLSPKLFKYLYVCIVQHCKDSALQGLYVSITYFSARPIFISVEDLRSPLEEES
jgi:hypothetical protein